MKNQQLTTQGKQSSEQSSVDDWTMAVVTLCDRVRAGFGVADAEKFGGWCSEVKIACRGFSPSEIQDASNRLMRCEMRPNIGEVYRALAAAGRDADLLGRASRPPLPRPEKRIVTPEEAAEIRRRVDAKYSA